MSLGLRRNQKKNENGGDENAEKGAANRKGLRVKGFSERSRMISRRIGPPLKGLEIAGAIATIPAVQGLEHGTPLMSFAKRYALASDKKSQPGDDRFRGDTHSYIFDREYW